MEIRAQDLRIGNKVLFAIDGTEFTVIDITKGGLGVEDAIESTWIEMDQFEGIPLTKEWLIKFGFKRGDNITTNDSFYWIPVGASEFAINPDNGIVWITSPNGNLLNNPTLIQYAHQLQNLFFCLTGTELTIKP